MPRFKGNGPGHGGPAKGAGNKGAGPGRGNTHRSVAEILAAQGARELAASRWLDILEDPAHPHHASMIVKAAERMDGAAAQRIVVATNPDEMTDEQLAAIAAGGGGVPTGKAGEAE